MSLDWLNIQKEEQYEDPQKLMQDLAQSFYSGNKRTKMDRYRDFVDVFHGSDAGKRVLWEIMAWGGIYRPETPEMGPIDVNRVFEKIGRKKIVLDILTVLLKEPKLVDPAPGKQNKDVNHG